MTTLRSGGGAGEQTADLAGLFNYPSLGRLLEGGDPRALEEMRGRLTRTAQELERVVRQGSREDADRAARAARAVTLTLELLDSLEGMRREGTSR
ncbi:MAG TPA: hypothetical protein VGX48_11115 [Pyrinomonadaceae bacterium]|jgi:hypothetical protein|nr:hypothetical protein [Pyrinomonadaceae bacterium]